MIQKLVDLPTRYPRLFAGLWRAGGSVVAFLALFVGTAQFVSTLAHEEETQLATYDDPAIAVVQVDSDAGSVDIVGGERDAITVRSEISDGLIATDHRAEIVDDRLVLTARCPWFVGQFCEVDYTIEVPADVAVVVDVGNGSVSVQGVDGDVDVHAGNGGVELDDLGGSVAAQAGNGDVTGLALRSELVEARAGNGSVRLSWEAEPHQVEARAGNGSVELVLPDSRVAYRVDFDSDNGSVDTQVRTDPTSDRSLWARAGNGSVTARYP